MLLPFTVSNVASRNIFTSRQAMMKSRSRCTQRVVHKCGVGYIGDRILVAIRAEKKKGILIGLRQQQIPKIPKFDSNNLVLINDNGTLLNTSRLRVVDNSEIGKQVMMEDRPCCIHVYNKRGMGYIGSNLSKHYYMNYSGDFRILIAIQCDGQWKEMKEVEEEESQVLESKADEVKIEIT
ncbi:39S ribosomal protein L14, mitochondrial [Atta colombica]|uniref:39S ribosomal protein L14, mitochondrial n=1 Tax=Atta colombica TaxID=520822 RepID=A0A195BTK1_9HYME|nr:39S ribosomal protein L14, mitochondrial [Atta colombica]